MNFRKIIVVTGITGALVLISGCSAPVASSPTITTNTASAVPTPSDALPVLTNFVKLPAGVIVKRVAHDGTGDYLQTGISENDPAMKYNPVITDDEAKAHYSDTELAEAQKVIVKFIAEEAIDSTLNGGNTDFDGWFAAHKNEIFPASQSTILKDIKDGKGVLATENWMSTKEDYSYVHGDNTPRVTARTITPTKFYYVKTDGVQGVTLETEVTYSMAVTKGAFPLRSIQKSTGDLSFTVAQDSTDGGKWKIAGYKSTFHTEEG
jgi:hypothetical protein